jgi:hypothetical protein
VKVDANGTKYTMDGVDDQDGKAGAKAFNLNLGFAIDVGVKLDTYINYAKVKYTEDVKDLYGTQKLTKFGVSADAGVAKVSFDYAKAGSDGGYVILGKEDGAMSNFSKIGIRADKITAPKAKFYHLGVSAPVGPVKVGLDYAKAKATGNKAHNTRLTVAYAMSKNFKVTTFIQAGKKDNGATKTGASRVELLYKF